MYHCLVIFIVSSTDQIYHLAASRLGDKYDQSMTLSKLLDNNTQFFIFISLTNSNCNELFFCFQVCKYLEELPYPIHREVWRSHKSWRVSRFTTLYYTLRSSLQILRSVVSDDGTSRAGDLKSGSILLRGSIISKRLHVFDVYMLHVH